MSSLLRDLRNFGRFYVNHTIMGATGLSRTESFSMKALRKIKYVPFYMILLVGSTVTLVMGVTGFVFTGALIAFEGTSNFSNTGLLASSILTGAGIAVKVGLFFYIRQKEKQLRSLQETLKAFHGIKEVFIAAFARELIEEQNKIVRDVMGMRPDAMKDFVAQTLH